MAVEAQKEQLTQHLFAAGMTLRMYEERGAAAVSQQRLKRTVEVLDQVMNDLLSAD